MIFSAAAAPFTIPFVVFMALLVLFGNVWHPDALTEQAVRVGVMVPVLLWAGWKLHSRAARGKWAFRVPHWAASIAVGAGIFALWIAPDLLWPAYRHSWLFQNALMGTTHPGPPTDAVAWGRPLVRTLRAFRAVIIVPIVEELFWRGWLMRLLAVPKAASQNDHGFETVPMGTYAPLAFWAVALLFAAEHGPYWDVGLAAGIIFNAWLVRTKSLSDLILAHAVANAGLSAYVLLAGRWEYWQ